MPSDPISLQHTLTDACLAAAALFLAPDLTESEADTLAASCRVLRPLLDPAVEQAAQTCVDDMLSRLTIEG